MAFRVLVLACASALATLTDAHAHAAEPDMRASDTPLTEAAAASGSVARLSPRPTLEGSGSAFATRVGTAISPRLALSVDATPMSDASQFSPSIQGRWQLLAQERTSVDATAAVAYTGIGPEGTEGAAARLSVARTFGRLRVTMNGAVGRGLGARTDVDAEATASAMMRVASDVHVGAESRVRAELVDEFKTDEDVGRSAEMAGGAVAMVRVQNVRLRGWAGWDAPRGWLPPGPLAFAWASVGF